MALILTFLGLLAAVVFAPETQAGRFLHRALVEAPARRLARISRGNALIAVGLVASLAGAFWLIDKELALVMSMMAPEALAWVAMFDIATLVDAFITVALITTTVRFHQVTAILRGARPRARTTRTRPQRPTASNDDGDRLRYALAA